MLGNMMRGVTPLVNGGFGMFLVGCLLFWEFYPDRKAVFGCGDSVVDSYGVRGNLSYDKESFFNRFYLALGGDEQMPAPTVRLLSLDAGCGADNEGDRAQGYRQRHCYSQRGEGC